MRVDVIEVTGELTGEEDDNDGLLGSLASPVVTVSVNFVPRVSGMAKR
jgi:hypothetical protein